MHGLTAGDRGHHLQVTIVPSALTSWKDTTDSAMVTSVVMPCAFTCRYRQAVTHGRAGGQ
jgi:hypothetical protein